MPKTKEEIGAEGGQEEEIGAEGGQEKDSLFSSLPKEIKALILSYLDERNLKKVAVVSKEWKQLAGEISEPADPDSIYLVFTNVTNMKEVNKDLFLKLLKSVKDYHPTFKTFDEAAQSIFLTTLSFSDLQAILRVRDIKDKKLSTLKSEDLLSLHVVDFPNGFKNYRAKDYLVSDEDRLNSIQKMIENITSNKEWKDYKDVANITLNGKKYSMPRAIHQLYLLIQDNSQSPTERLQSINELAKHARKEEPGSTFFGKVKELVPGTKHEKKVTDIADRVEKISAPKKK